MSRLLDVFDELRETQAELGRLEATVAAHPEYESLTLDLFSIQKRQESLQAEFQKLASEKHVDIVSYKIIPNSSARVPLRAMTSTLDRFQAAVSTVYDAIKFGVKQKTKITAEVATQSGFDFAYTFSGSLGVVLTVPNERLLFGESELDRAVELFFSAAHAQRREQIVEFARTAGISSVRRLFEWSQAHSAYDTSADIQLRRDTEIRKELAVEVGDLSKLQEIIKETSDTEEIDVDISGSLVGLDTTLETFHIVVPGADEDIQGSWSAEFQYDPDIKLKGRYQAKLLKKSTTYYAYEKDEIKWFLKKLRPDG
jgi:hypothetical protein